MVAIVTSEMDKFIMFSNIFSNSYNISLSFH